MPNLGNKKVLYGGLALVGGVILFVFIKSKSSKTTQTAAQAAAAGASGASSALNPYPASPASYTVYTPSVAGSMPASAAQGTDLTGYGVSTIPNGAPGTEPVVGAYQGSGYLPGQTGIVNSIDGNAYQWVTAQSQVDALGGYSKLYAQPLPGVFVPWNSNDRAGTPVFASVPYNAVPLKLAGS